MSASSASKVWPPSRSTSSRVSTNTSAPSIFTASPGSSFSTETAPGPPRSSMLTIRSRAVRARSAGEMPRNGARNVTIGRLRTTIVSSARGAECRPILAGSAFGATASSAVRRTRASSATPAPKLDIAQAANAAQSACPTRRRNRVTVCVRLPETLARGRGFRPAVSRGAAAARPSGTSLSGCRNRRRIRR